MAATSSSSSSSAAATSASSSSAEDEEVAMMEEGSNSPKAAHHQEEEEELRALTATPASSSSASASSSTSKKQKPKKLKLGTSAANNYHAVTGTKPLLLDLQPEYEPESNYETKKFLCCKMKKKKKEAKKSVSLFEIYMLLPSMLPVLVLGLVASVLNGGMLPAFAIVFGELFNAFGDETDEIRDQSQLVAIIFVAIGVGSFICYYISLACMELVSEKITRKLRIMLFDSLMHKDVAFFDRHQTGELTAKLTGEIVIVQGGVGHKVGKIVTSWSQLVAGIAIAFVYGWKLTLVLLALSPVMILSGTLQAVFLKRSSKSGQKAFALSTNIAEESLAGFRTVTSFVMENSIVATYDKSLEKPTKLGIQRAHLMGLGVGFAFFNIFATYALGFWYGGNLVADDEMDPGDLLTVFFSIVIGSMGLGEAGQAMPDITKGRAAATTIFDIILEDTKINPNFGTGIRLPEGEKLKGKIELSHVKFAYPARPDTMVFQDLSLKIDAGEHLALVGPSGSGKSSVVSLVSRFYDVSGGVLMIDDRPITDYDLYWLRHQIGLVSQEPILFSCSIEENIRFGKPDATSEEVIEAAKAANAHNFISQLPEGYSTKTGERGCQLSGGQKQRIAIARAILKDPSILLLDEATSALDTESESLVQEALDKLMQGRTSISVAHRLATVRDADCIAVMQKGKIVEKGTHEELLAESLIYNKLVHRQLEGEERSRAQTMLQAVDETLLLADSATRQENKRQGKERINAEHSNSSSSSSEEEDEEEESEATAD
ncbi:ABC transporter B family member 15 [Balamuthia mandrillaris]